MPENVVRLRRDTAHKGLRLLFALALGLTVVASMATQQSAHAAVEPATAVIIGHQCEAIGVAPNGNEAVVCSDLAEQPVAGGMETWGTGEYFCQGPSHQCAGIHASNTMLTPVGTTIDNEPFQCDGAGCPNGRALVSTEPHWFEPTGQCDTFKGTVSRVAAIRVIGMSTAFHPETLTVTKQVCG